ncbi:MAG: hypothetical protein CMC13_00430 [Flavobacteriaceae bacterium]|nr:hypothetical protein [Flavobacteriaceae bacterium]
MKKAKLYLKISAIMLPIILFFLRLFPIDNDNHIQVELRNVFLYIIPIFLFISLMAALFFMLFVEKSKRKTAFINAFLISFNFFFLGMTLVSIFAKFL